MDINKTKKIITHLQSKSKRAAYSWNKNLAFW